MNGLAGQYLGRYHIVEQLGEGGMATVYQAFDTRLERTVAVKMIRTDMILPAMIENILQRFEQEARVLAKFSHPNIVSIYDYGEYQNAPYLVMEYLPGGTLKQQTGTPLPYSNAARLLLPVARALEYAHQREVFHRDVKPANILISASGEVKLSDFGIAKVLEMEQATQLTGTGVGIGTPEYMAPEQWMGEVYEQTDQYALGVVLYELVTGRKPYIADTPAAVLLKQMNEQLPRPRLFNPDIPEVVEQVLFKALAKKPEDRYPNMGAFAQALESLIDYANAARESKIRQQDLPTMIERPGMVKTGRKWLQKIQSSRLPVLWMRIIIGGAVLVGCIVLLIFFGLMSRVIWPAFTGAQSKTDLASSRILFPTETDAETAQTLDETATPSPAAVTILATASPSATRIPSPTVSPTPTLGVGSKQISQKDNMVMVYVPEGEFLMGADPSDRDADRDERPQHTVFLDAFWIDQTEVTNARYALCVRAGACQPPRKLDAPSVTDDYYGNPLFDDFPVIYVSWNDAVDYCAWAGRRLPTEAEWEKAARGLKGQKYPWGNQAPNGFLVNLCDASCTFEAERDASYNDGYPGVAQVGAFPQGMSPFEVYDMAGNVNEWVADFYGENYYSVSPASNPKGPEISNLHVLRGGAAYLRAWYARASHRAADWPKSNYPNLGFRCAASP
jgi:eukaryotic-like serine/threonine-protein kinase